VGGGGVGGGLVITYVSIGIPVSLFFFANEIKIGP